jgi:rod shape determining protein RodA
VKLLIKPLIQEPVIFILTVILLLVGIYILHSLSPDLFPQYYLYLVLSILVFYIFYSIGFEIIKYFSAHLYVLSIILLLLTLIIGRVTRGAIRWIPLGIFSFQPSEIIRPFLLIFFARILSVKINGIKNILFYAFLAALPIILIAIQPSFGVALLTLIGISSIFVIKKVNGKNLLITLILILVAIPSMWYFLRPYQKERVMTFFSYSSDPRGAGYNTIQSIIAVGSGGIFGRGFKKGFQTQLRFLPEKHTDFVFAGISEELGFLGSASLLIIIFIIIYRILYLADKSKDGVYTLFSIGTAIILLTETLINIGMNLGLLPITGLPLPLVSAGGSSIISLLITFSLIINGKNIKP